MTAMPNIFNAIEILRNYSDANDAKKYLNNALYYMRQGNVLIERYIEDNTGSLRLTQIGPLVINLISYKVQYVEVSRSAYTAVNACLQSSISIQSDVLDVTLPQGPLTDIVSSGERSSDYFKLGRIERSRSN